MKYVKKFLDSIYLGDRFCENIEILDGKITFQINCISRLEEGTEEWNYYSKRDIEHGILVFDEVIDFVSSTDLPLNDEIYEIQLIEKKDDIYSFVVYGCNVSDEALSIDVELKINAKKFYIYDPNEKRNIFE